MNFWRLRESEPFEEDDLSLAEELTARAAVCIDNARRFTREHAMAVTLQHSLLPRGLPEQNALDVAYRYLSAQAGVGGDWFDVIPLPGTRVALVVGDVVGHGLHAAATMGRLRTAVQNFSALDLPPDELLGHLDELVARIDQEAAGGGDEAAIVGATCLYAIYDPASGTCTMARAGHPLPALVSPEGTVDFPELPAGPPLGLGGMPFEAAELRVPEGSSLVLYTDGLVEDRMRDIDTGLAVLRATLERAGQSPQDTCEALIEALLPERQTDDIALLVANTRMLAPDQIAEWELPSDPAVVARARADVTRQLSEWGAGGDGVHRRAHPQRADHQCDPARLRADPGAPAAGQHLDLRGLRHQQHLAPPAVRGRGGRGRPRPVPRRPARRPLGHPLHRRGAR
ncbi:hypothetical protein GCM10020000_74150 [Streptomyces olivoverticillatus]